MKLIKDYKNIKDVLIHLKLQVADSLDTAQILTQGITTPEQLFEYLRSLVIYKNDPSGRELLQSVQTLLLNNRHGISGAGDCDCFTILCLACLYWLPGVTEEYVIIAGNTKQAPTHIWAGAIWKGHFYEFDLTEPYLNKTRPYKIVQQLQIIV